MYTIGGMAGFNGITFHTLRARVHVTASGRGETQTLFSRSTGGLKAWLRKIPLVRMFPAFGKIGTVIFSVLIGAFILEIFWPQLLETNLPDEVLYGAAAALLIVIILTRKRVKKLLQYHGAEHMALNTYSAGKEMTVENIAAADRATPKCGSVMTLIFIVLAMPLLLLPYAEYFILLAFAVSFELYLLLLKKARPVWLLRFALWIQRRFLTRPPDAAQIEVAMRGMLRIIELMDHSQDIPCN